MSLQLLLFIFLYSILRISIVDANQLTKMERKAISEAKNILNGKLKKKSRKPLLCVTFISLQNLKSINNLNKNIIYANVRCDWAVIQYDSNSIENTTVKMAAAKTIYDSANIAKSVVVLLNEKYIPSKKYRADHNLINTLNGTRMKPILYHYLLPNLDFYSKVWLMDDDISIVGFDFDAYFGIWNCAFNGKGPLPAVTQPLLIGKDLPPFSRVVWKMYNNSVIAIKSAWIEQQTPIFDTQFFSWFVDYIITPVYNDIAKSRVDCGQDCTWCGAAKVWNDLKFQASNKDSNAVAPNPACAVIMGDNHVTHNDYRTISDWHNPSSDWSSRCSSLMKRFRSTFPSMYYFGLNDESFTDRDNWYAKSSGTCLKEPSLDRIPTEILHTKQVRKQFIKFVNSVFHNTSSIVDDPATRVASIHPTAPPSIFPTVQLTNLSTFQEPPNSIELNSTKY